MDPEDLEDPEDWERDENVDDARAALLWHARAYADLGLADVAEDLGRRKPFPPQLHGTPMILDTDIGGNPDDAVALAVAARQVPQLALVLTTDEQDGQRARFARHLLDLLGRADVPVVAGRELDPEGRRFCVEGLVPDELLTLPADVTAAVAEVMAATDGPVRWTGLGPMSNLADFVAAHPELADRLYLKQMAGAVNHADPLRGQRNLRRDVSAARAALPVVNRPWLVTADVGAAGELAITTESPVYQRLSGPDAPAWARLLKLHFDHWFEQHHPSSSQHDPLTVAMGIGLPFVNVLWDRAVFDERGRMRVDPSGVELTYTYDVLYDSFWRWLTNGLDVAVANTDREPPGGRG